MTDLVKTDESSGAWYPVPIDQLDTLLTKVISSGHGYTHVYALRRNIAYNLQYIEYLHKTLTDIKLSGVLFTQTWKTIILTGCGILESLLYFLLVKRDIHSKSEWQLKIIMPGNQKALDGVQSKIDGHLYTKLSSPKAIQMNFDSIIKKAKTKKVLGSKSSIYTKLDNLRQLRNKVHLQAIDNPTDTDWNSFNRADVNDMDELLYSTFTSNIFTPSAYEKSYFKYLHDYYTAT